MKTSIDAFGTTVNINDEVIYYSGYSAYSPIKGVNYKALNKGIVTKITPKGVTIDKVINRPSNKIYKSNDLRVSFLTKIVCEMQDSLVELAYLGGLPNQYGNSTGNQIAINALERFYRQMGVSV
jgi:hypothetical protein